MIIADYDHYTIPRNNRELQRRELERKIYEIIPYQEIIGNYSNFYLTVTHAEIIPYQEIIGNYSMQYASCLHDLIIPYQEIIGNYSIL